MTSVALEKSYSRFLHQRCRNSPSREILTELGCLFRFFPLSRELEDRPQRAVRSRPGAGEGLLLRVIIRTTRQHTQSIRLYLPRQYTMNSHAWWSCTENYTTARSLVSLEYIASTRGHTMHMKNEATNAFQWSPVTWYTQSQWYAHTLRAVLV